MKRWISILILAAMMLSLVATAIPVFAIESENVSLDTAELESLVERVRSLNEDEYNSISYRMLIKSVEKSEKLLASVYNGQEVTQKDIDAALDDLKQKIDGLKLLDGTPAPFDPEIEETESEIETEMEPETEPAIDETGEWLDPGADQTETIEGVDKSALEKAIADAKKLKQEDYQSNAIVWRTFINAIDAAENVLNSKYATAEDVEEAIANIEKKKAALVPISGGVSTEPPVTESLKGKDLLQVLLTEAKAINPLDYQGNALAWAMFTNAIKTAETILNNETATDEEISQAIQNLKNRKAALVPTVKETESEQTETDTNTGVSTDTSVSIDTNTSINTEAVDKSALKNAIDSASRLKKADYQGNLIAWQMFERALSRAQDVFANVNSGYEDIKDAIEDLENKKGLLVPTPIGSETETLITEPPKTESFETETLTTEPPVTEPPAIEFPTTHVPSTGTSMPDITTDIPETGIINKEPSETEIITTDILDTEVFVDKTLLKAVIDVCYSCKKDAWQGDVDAWNAFEAELMAAEFLYADQEATQDAVDAMVMSLQVKKDALKVTIYNREALKTLIDNCKMVSKDAWQGDVNAWAAFEQELAKAEEIYNNPNALQEEVNGVIESLHASSTALKATIYNRDILENIVKDYQLIKKEEWQGDIAAWNVFEKELFYAQLVLANENASQSDINNMIDSLQQKRVALKATLGMETGVIGGTDNMFESGQFTDIIATDEFGSEIIGAETLPPVESGVVESATETQVSTGSNGNIDLFNSEQLFSELGLNMSCESAVSISAIFVVGVIGTAIVIKKKDD